MNLVLVRWEDIISETGWCNPEEVSCPVFETIGYLIKDTKKYLVICDTVPDYGTVTVFPKGCVLEVRDVKKS